MLHWLAANWALVLFVAFCVAVWALVDVLMAQVLSPHDTTSNGIAIGRAKAFDNRSLALRIERLNTVLETLKPVTSKATESSSEMQERTVSETSLSASANVQPGGGSDKKDKPSDGGGKSGEQSGSGDKSGDKKDGDDKLGIAASDVLTDQLNLASQIFNLQMLYERSLSDRIISEGTEGNRVSNPRMQTVLGLQVSITPPAGAEDCAAVVEIAVQPRNGNVTEPISLVAMMPQEKTYNATSLSTSERSISGSAVAKILNFNLGGKSRARQYFLHRDSDTVAFERNPQADPKAFPDADRATVFGWEFRPVLGRRVVTAGTRQMLAVVSLPMGEHDQGEDLLLDIKSRSYWRRYNRRTQTTKPKSSWVPWRFDRSGTVDFPIQVLAIPNICKVQDALKPKVSGIKWVNTGQGSAAVTVKGQNFFSGTQVVIGGKVYRESDENNRLTLKSDQALEFHTSIESLTADAVLSGRFGPTERLEMAKGEVKSLDIPGMVLERLKNSDTYRLSIDVVGQDDDVNDKPYTVEYINKFPEPILFIGTEPVPMPYDYYEIDPKKTTGSTTSSALPAPASNPPGSAPASAAPAPAAATPAAATQAQAAVTTTQATPTSGATPLPPSTEKYVTVQVFVSGKLLAKNPSVAFRVPFCGMEYQVSKPITFADPTIVRLGEDPQGTRFRISLAAVPGDGTSASSPSPISVDLDRNYVYPDLQMLAQGQYLLRVPTDKVARYENLVVRVGTSESYVLRIPPMEKPIAKPSVDSGSPPPEIAVNGSGSVEWSGTSLDSIAQVKLGTTALDFAVYGNGTKLRVYLKPAQTSVAAKLTLEGWTNSGERLSLPLFVK